MNKLFIVALISMSLWAFSLPGQAASADSFSVRDERGASTTGIIWKCGRPGCPGYRKVSIDAPDFGYPWQDWFPRTKK